MTFTLTLQRLTKHIERHVVVMRAVSLHYRCHLRMTSGLPANNIMPYLPFFNHAKSTGQDALTSHQTTSFQSFSSNRVSNFS